MMLVFLFLVLVVIVEDRPIVLALRAVRETFARAALHDHADDQAQHQADADQASDTLAGVSKRKWYSSVISMLASLLLRRWRVAARCQQPHKHNVNQYTAHAWREDFHASGKVWAASVPCWAFCSNILEIRERVRRRYLPNMLNKMRANLSSILNKTTDVSLRSRLRFA